MLAILCKHLFKSLHKRLWRITEKATFRIAVWTGELKRGEGEDATGFDRAEVKFPGTALLMCLEYRYKSNDVIYNVGGTFISRSILLCPLSHGLSGFTNAVPFQIDKASLSNKPKETCPLG